jgi:hypothetical protein
MPTLGQLARAGASGFVGGAVGWPMDTAVNAANLLRAGVGYGGHKLGLLNTEDLPETIDNAEIPGTGAHISKMMGVGDSGAEQLMEFITSFLSPGPKIKGPKSDLFAGKRAKNADLKLLDDAKEMAKAGADRKMIWDATGWFQGPDKKWRFEIDDSKVVLDRDAGFAKAGQQHNKRIKDLDTSAELRQSFEEFVGPHAPGSSYIDRSNYMLGKYKTEHGKAPSEKAVQTASLHPRDDILQLQGELARNPPEKDQFRAPMRSMFKHDELIAAYPDVARSKVEVDPFSGRGGSYSPSTKEIKLGSDAAYEQPRGRQVLLHEIQHAIQEKEKFAGGGSPAMFQENIFGMPPPNHHLSPIDRYLTKKREGLLQTIKNMELYTKKNPAGAGMYKYEIGRLKQLIDELDTQALNGLGEREAMQAYRKIMGEAESRAVEARRNMTPAERQATPPWESYDNKWEDLFDAQGRRLR